MPINVRRQHFSILTNLKFSAEVIEEFYPELPIMHVVQAHLLLDLVADQVPGFVSITPTSSPLVLVPPGITDPDQTNPLLVLGV